VSGGARISGWQLTMLLLMSRLMLTAVIFPEVTGAEGYRDVWAAVLLGAVGALLLGILVVWLGGRFPGRTVAQYSQQILGRPLGFVAAFGLFTFYLLVAGLTVRVVAESYRAAIMTETPSTVFIGISTVLCLAVARAGVEVLARSAEITGYVVMTTIAIVFLMSLPFIDPGNLMPPLQSAPGAIVDRAVLSFGFFADVSLAAMLLPYLHSRGPALRSVLAVVVLSGLTVASAAGIVVAVFGPGAPRLTLPVYMLARQVRLGMFLERLEVVPLAAWTLLVWLRGGLFLWAAATGIGQLLGLERPAVLLPPLALIVGGLGVVLVEGLDDLFSLFSPAHWGLYASVQQAGLIVLLATVAAIRRARARLPDAAGRMGGGGA